MFKDLHFANLTGENIVIIRFVLFIVHEKQRMPQVSIFSLIHPNGITKLETDATHFNRPGLECEKTDLEKPFSYYYNKVFSYPVEQY